MRKTTCHVWDVRDYEPTDDISKSGDSKTMLVPTYVFIYVPNTPNFVSYKLQFIIIINVFAADEDATHTRVPFPRNLST